MKAHLDAVALHDRLPKSFKISPSSLQVSPPYVYQLQYVNRPAMLFILTCHCSLQYHHTILLLHRPFFQLLNPGKKGGIPYDPLGGDIHSKSVKDSAVRTARILQIFRKNYTNVSVPRIRTSQLVKLTTPAMYPNLSRSPNFHSINHPSTPHESRRRSWKE